MRQISHAIFVLLSIIGALSLAISLTILSGGLIYRVYLQLNDLATPVGLTTTQLLENIDHMMSYLILPMQNKLVFPHFSSSTGGLQHFAEVKQLIQFNFILSLLALCYFAWERYFIQRNGLRFIRKQLLQLAYYFPIALLMVIVVAFERLFIVFHQLFFRNDLWLFNPTTDPIIYVLPQMLFMIYFIVGIVIYLLIIFIYRKII